MIGMSTARLSCIGKVEAKPRTLDPTYAFCESARRAIFFAKFEAERRSDDKATYHITLEDLLAGIKKEQGD